MCMASARTRAILTWTLSLLLALMFAFSAIGKLRNGTAPNGGDWDSQFVAWGLPAAFRLLVGAAELLGAIALVLPAVRFYGAAGLAGVMLGATVTHVANAEWMGAAIPFVLAALLAPIAWMTRPAWVAARLPGSNPA